MKKDKIVIILLFVLLYCPIPIKNLVGVSANYLVAIISLLIMTIIIIKQKNKFVLEIIKQKPIKFFILGIISSSIYFLIIFLIRNNNDNVNLKNMRLIQNMMSIIYIIDVIMLISILKKKNYNVEERLKVLFKASAIQGLFCIGMISFPFFKNIANWMFTKYSQFNSGDYILKSRIYGISTDYTYGMPLFHGLLCGICLYYCLKKNKKYFIYYFLIMIVALLNSRTGLIVSIITSITVMVYIKLKEKKYLELLKYIILSIIAFIIGLLLLKIYKYETYKSLMAIFEEIVGIFNGTGLTGTSKYLFDSHFYFPKGTSFLIGEGHRVYSKEALTFGCIPSDIGFVNDMFMGGVIYCILLYGSYIKISINNKLKKEPNVIKIIIAIALIIANLKGQIFVNSIFVIGILYISINYMVSENISSHKEE